uniref:H15 domain-containing protein n=1 Tax=Poecilia reticulata TaxID=8081 RepID=A0A3P9NNN4_POERE
MAEEAPAAVKAPAKAPKKKSAPRAKKDGPSLSKLIVAAVADSKERKGVSLAALKKVLAGKGVDVAKLVTGGTLSQTKGTGASGSFKLAKKEPKETCLEKCGWLLKEPLFVLCVCGRMRFNLRSRTGCGPASSGRTPRPWRSPSSSWRARCTSRRHGSRSPGTP